MRLLPVALRHCDDVLLGSRHKCTKSKSTLISYAMRELIPVATESLMLDVDSRGVSVEELRVAGCESSGACDSKDNKLERGEGCTRREAP